MNKVFILIIREFNLVGRQVVSENLWSYNHEIAEIGEVW